MNTVELLPFSAKSLESISDCGFLDGLGRRSKIIQNSSQRVRIYVRGDQIARPASSHGRAESISGYG